MPRLSAYLKSTYLLYKEATDKSLSWVVGKAKDLGYSLDKGVIGTKSILECAQWIADHGPKNTVSYSFAVALNYAIAIRTSHGRARSGKDLKSDERHQYFLGVLEKVRETLSSLMDPKVAKAAGIHVDSAITLSNKFAQLEVEEPSEEFLQAPDVFLPPIKARFEEERDSREEALLAIELILEDYKSFRNVIRECWQEYHEGARDLIEISVVTNTAIDLARRLEADAKVLIDECGGLTTIFRQYCENSGEKAPMASEDPEDQNDFSVHELEEPFLGSTFTILESFLRSVRDDSLPITDAAREGPGALPKLRKCQPFDSIVAETKRKADESFLHSMLLDFYIVTTKMKPLLPEDELTRGLRAVFETKELSLWVIFALQVYLDINYVLQNNVARGFWDFSKFAESIHESINRNFELFQDIPCDPWPFSKDEALQQIQFDIRKIAADDIIRQRKTQLGVSAALMGGSNSHWKSHPIRCGLLAYNIRMRYQELSVLFESKWQTIYYTYTLYYALRLQNLLRTPWKDMDALIKLQPQIDLSGRAKTLSDLVIRVSNDLGWSARVSASDRRIGSRIPIVDQRDQHIRLQERNTVALMFKKRLCDNDGRTNFTEEDLVDILSKAVPVTNGKIQKSQKSQKNEKSQKSKKNKKGKRGHKSKKGPQDESSNDERPTISQLLQALTATLVSEKSSSDFDYLEFNRLCWELLRNVRPECEPIVIQKMGVNYLPHDHLPFMCLAILNRGMDAMLDGERVGRALFVKAGDCYAAFLRNNGSNIVDAAASRGFDPTNDFVEALNSRYDKDGGFKEIMKGPGDKESKQYEWARQVTEKKMDELIEGFGPLAPQLKRMLQERMFGEDGKFPAHQYGSR